MILTYDTVTVTTDASGDSTDYTEVLDGVILDVRYVKTDFEDTVDFTVTAETTGKAVLTVTNVTASTTWHITAQQVDTSAADALYGRVGIGNERLKIVTAGGGDSKSGTFYITIAGRKKG